MSGPSLGFPELRLDQKGIPVEPKQFEMFIQKIRTLLADPATTILAGYLAAGSAVTIAVNPITKVLTISVTPCAVSVDIGTMTAATVTKTAGGTYGSNEQNMLADIKTAVNSLINDRDTIKSNVNDWKGKSRTAKLLST